MVSLNNILKIFRLCIRGDNDIFYPYKIKKKLFQIVLTQKNDNCNSSDDSWNCVGNIPGSDSKINKSSGQTY